MTYFYRKAYDQLKQWKNHYADHYALMLEGPRRVGKSTIAQQFADNEYRSSIIINFDTASNEILSCFENLSDLNLFFLRLQAATGVQLYPRESLIVFDEVQLFPKARQAIKTLVKDGRYHYLETGSLISIKANVKNILIPSEEMKLRIYPMDYEEFTLASKSPNFEILRSLYNQRQPVGNALNRKLMRDFRIYMAVGGMPQAVEAYVSGASFQSIDRIKREIIQLYDADFHKLDRFGRAVQIYHSIPSELMRDTKRYYLTSALNKKRNSNADREVLLDLIDSHTVLICHNTLDPSSALNLTTDLNSYKLYLADTGLFLTLMFMDQLAVENEIYTKLLSDNLPANLGYLYENVMAQMIAASGRHLFYHTFRKPNSTHDYEVDFLTSSASRLNAIEVKSSKNGKHESLDNFFRKYHRHVAQRVLFSQKDFEYKDGVLFLPMYFAPLFLESKNDDLKRII